MFVHEVEKQEYFVSELCFREENKMKRKHLTEHGSMIEKEIQLFFLFFSLRFLFMFLFYALVV